MVMDKLTSRKFWMALAAFFGSIATGVAALHSGYEIVAGIGVGCGIVAAAASAVVYTLAEASIDKAAVSSNQTMTTTSTSVTATSASQKAVEAALLPSKEEQK